MIEKKRKRPTKKWRSIKGDSEEEFVEFYCAKCVRAKHMLRIRKKKKKSELHLETVVIDCAGSLKTKH